MRDKDIANETDFSPQAWVHIDASKDKTAKFRTRKQLEQYRCKTNEFSIQQLADYDANNNVIRVVNFGLPEFSRVVPGTVGEGLLMAACPSGSLK
jgi:hypothetical protein